MQHTAAPTLKHQTAVPHQELEGIVLPCLQAIATKNDYAQLLKAFYGYFKPLEDAVAPFISPQTLPDWPQRRKASFILNDLSALADATVDLPRASALPTIQSVPQAMGALYVMEGSTLGGKGIAKMLMKNRSTGLEEAHLQFFNGYGDHTGPMWTTFVNVLNSFSGNEQEVAQMVTAANETFSLFKTWLQEVLVHD